VAATSSHLCLLVGVSDCKVHLTQSIQNAILPKHFFRIFCVSITPFAAAVASGHVISKQPRRLRLNQDITRNASPMYDSINHLKHISTRFYIYNDPVISQSHVIDKCRGMGDSAFGASVELVDHIQADSNGERVILKALEQHPLRTMNPKQAEIFIVPTPISELLACGCQWENCTLLVPQCLLTAY